VNSAVSLARARGAESFAAPAATWSAQAWLVRKASAACASGPEVGSVRPYSDSWHHGVPMKLFTALFL
jgi:hypothetical protein